MAQVAKTCEGCSKKHSAYWCEDCRKEYCKTCCQIHNGFQKHEKHTILKIEEVCKDHNYEHSHFCTTCESFLCKECVFGKHKQHDIDEIQKVASDYRENLLEMGKELVETLESVSKLKVSMQSEQANSLSTIKQFKDNAKKCANKVKLIVKTVLYEYIAMTTEFKNNDEDTYEEISKRVKIFEDTQSASLSQLKEVWNEKNPILFITLFMKIKENVQENQTCPCPPKRMELVPFNPNGMVSTVVERITSEFKSKEQQSLSEQIVNAHDEIKKLRKENKKLLQDEEKLRKDIESLKKSEKLKLTKILQEKEEELRLQNQKFDNIQHQPTVSTKQFEEMQLMVETLKGEKESLLQRLTRVANRELTRVDNRELTNQAVADLRDPHRPVKLSDKFREIFENTWGDLLDVITAKTGASDEICVKQIISALTIIYGTCKGTITNNGRDIAKLLGYPEDLFDKPYDAGKEGHGRVLKILKELLQVSVIRQSESVSKNIKQLPKIKTILEVGGKYGNAFIAECLQLCLDMCTQDPPVVLDFSCKSGDAFDKVKFTHYIKSGAVVDYVVWPVVYLSDNGVILNKGIAKGK